MLNYHRLINNNDEINSKQIISFLSKQFRAISNYKNRNEKVSKARKLEFFERFLRFRVLHPPSRNVTCSIGSAVLIHLSLTVTFCQSIRPFLQNIKLKTGKRKTDVTKRVRTDFDNIGDCLFRHKGFLKDCPDGLLTEQV